jgi:ribosomal protein S18 acetylase RimI-like enzyme
LRRTVGLHVEGSIVKMLDNVFWNSLSGPQRAWTQGTHRIRRYARGLPNLLAFQDPRHPALDEVAAFCEPGERFYCAGWVGPPPPGWRGDVEARLALMVWNGPRPGVALRGTRALDHQDRGEAQRLVVASQPGPFGERSFEPGDYLGCFADGRLVAMAGERMRVEGGREISAVCTDPEFRGRGLARMLVAELVRRQVDRGEAPFLHVLESNTPARDLYRSMGFRDHSVSPVRVVSWLGEPPSRPSSPARAPRSAA